MGSFFDIQIQVPNQLIWYHFQLMRFNAKAIILRGMNYGESDRILRLIVENRGKASAIAKGARKEKSKLREAVEPITLATFQFNPGRNMFTISQSDIISTFSAIKDSLENLMTSIFLCELIDEFTEEGNPDTESFELLRTALESIEKTESNLKLTAIYLEVQLHVINGIFPDLHQCVRCGSKKSASHVRLDIANGGALCSNCSSGVSSENSFPMNALFVLDNASTTSLEEFVNREYESSDINAAGIVISRFTNYYLAKALKSRSIMDSTLIKLERQ